MTMSIPDELPILGEGNEDFVYVNAEDFVTFWSERYEESQAKFEPLYADRINKNKFDKDDIQKFYQWFGLRIKNKNHRPTITYVTDRIDVVNDLKSAFKNSRFEIENFNNQFPNINARSKILLLHLIAPEKYPPFAEPAHRAYILIMDKRHIVPLHIPLLREKEIRTFYDNKYCCFFDELFDRISYDRKKLDEALWMLGKEYRRLIKDR